MNYRLSPKEIKKRVNILYTILEKCNLCPRNCQINRLVNKKGYCRAKRKVRVYNFMPHFGEEPPISGKRGSGTIFFSHCHLRCIYCQNWRFSQEGRGSEVEGEELAQMMLALQRRGCHNINLVTPTHYLPQIMESIWLARGKGLGISIVYNSSGYERIEILKLLEGMIDIYLVDMRYAREEMALRYSRARDYVKVNRAAIKEMYRQVGELVCDEEGIAKRGLIVRHLVLPGLSADAREIIAYVAREISPRLPLSLMSQYLPAYKAKFYPELNRKIFPEEYDQAVEVLYKYGLTRGWVQELPDDSQYPIYAGESIPPMKKVKETILDHIDNY